jgi:threonine/homoserine/homoserine lactone efflux protein
VVPLIFYKGLAVGFLMCAPLGPIGLICVRRTIMDGRRAGMASVLGASTVDAIYCSVAGLSITLLTSLLQGERQLLQAAGGVVLMAVGIRIFTASVPVAKVYKGPHGVIQAFVSTFLLTLANPMPILVFSAAFTVLGIHGWKGETLSTAILVAGVFSGSALWSPILVTIVTLFRPQFNPSRMRWLNRVTGSLISLIGLIAEIGVFITW